MHPIGLKVAVSEVYFIVQTRVNQSRNQSINFINVSNRSSLHTRKLIGDT